MVASTLFAVSLAHGRASAPATGAQTQLTPLGNGACSAGPILQHTATSANTFGTTTYLLGNEQLAWSGYILMVTPLLVTHPLGVAYYAPWQTWGIFNEDGAPMSVSLVFNVEVGDPSCGSFVHTATAANSRGDLTDLSNPLTDNHPQARVFVTPNWSAGGVLDPHPLEVAYDYGHWAIFHEDGAPMQAGAAYNVWAPPPGGVAVLVQHTATAANTWDTNLTYLDEPSLQGYTVGTRLFVTQVFGHSRDTGKSGHTSAIRALGANKSSKDGCSDEIPGQT